MRILDWFKNTFLYSNKYKTHSEAVIIACYFNPQNNPYRLIAFNKFYDSIKHLNHRIIECVIGDSTPQLPKSEFITVVETKSLLWHKETLLNNVVTNLPKEFKYVFWVDADVIFTNNNWLVDGVDKLKTMNIIQPFEYCVHLDKDQLKPSFNTRLEKEFVGNPKKRHPKMWRSFCANFETTDYSGDENYDKHGHVGFAWAARRDKLEQIGLYDRALIGGADHIMAHAAAGQIPHKCIDKSFTDDLDAVYDWSREFYKVMEGKVGYVKGDLYHIWHGDLGKREYLKRIQEFTSKAKNITERDDNGLFVTDKDDDYVKKYFDKREVKATDDFPLLERFNKISKLPTPNKNNKSEVTEYYKNIYPDSDNDFIESMVIAYMTNSTVTGTMLGGDVLGAAIGDLLNTNEETDDFSGGDYINNEENFS